MKRNSLISALFLGCALSTAAQSTIQLFNGPAFPIPSYYDDDNPTSTAISFQGGGADFGFFGGVGLTTGFGGGYTEEYYAYSPNTNGLLCHGFSVVVLPGGSVIGSAPVSNAGWSNNGDGALLTIFGFNPGSSGGFPIVLGTNISSNIIAPSVSWGGPLRQGEDGYLGVRLTEQDGLHYGWIHVALAAGPAQTVAPTVLEWAIETRPDTAIFAGAAPIALLAPPQIVRSGNIRLVWQSEIGKAYQVQFKSEIDSPLWSNLDFNSIATATTTAVDLPTTAAASFYRLVEVQ